MKADTVVVENFAQPGKTHRVDRTRYEAMRAAMLKALPAREPGFTREETLSAIAGRLPDAVFPGGKGLTWWSKAVQLDLEAKGVIVRHGRPARWRRSASSLP